MQLFIRASYEVRAACTYLRKLRNSIAAERHAGSKLRDIVGEMLQSLSICAQWGFRKKPVRVALLVLRC